MLKFVLIGILIIGLLGFVLWNFWKMILLKNKYFSTGEASLFSIREFKDVPRKIKTIRLSKVKNWIFAVFGTVFTIALIIAYFLIARNVFADNHTHSYEDSVIKNATCVETGILQQKCRYCDDKYEEPINIISHEYKEVSSQDSTCMQEGKKEYACTMCALIKTEKIPLKEHEYIAHTEKKSTCSVEGLSVKQCKNCDSIVQENIPVNDEHTFKVMSFTQSTFWGNGYNHYACEDCGSEEYSIRTENFNWIVILAIVVLIIAVIVMASIRVEEAFWEYTFKRPAFWVAMFFAFLSIVIMIVHWGVIMPHQEENKPVFQSISGAPVDCELVETKRTDSTYTENGTVSYKCKKCNEEYTEYLSLKEIDLEQISIYKEPTIEERAETEDNNNVDSAAEIPLNTKMSGNLTDTSDIDFYKVTIKSPGNIKFKFVHDANIYSYHWNATVYDVDKTTVLNEGYINSDEFGCSDLAAGTYYLKISPISGGNPLLNQFSNEKYYLTFVPECAEHTEKTQYFSEIPTCLKSTEITTVCDCCGMVVSTESKDPLEHSWSEWKIAKQSSAWSLGENTRTCISCNEQQSETDFTYWWVIPLIIAELIVLIVCIVKLVKESEKHLMSLLALLALSCSACVAVLNNPVFSAKFWDGIALGILLALNTTLIVIFLVLIIDSMIRKPYYSYEIMPFVASIFFAITLILGFTVFSGYAVSVVFVMAALAIISIVWAIIAHNDYEDTWMVVNAIVALLSTAAAVFFSFRI